MKKSLPAFALICGLVIAAPASAYIGAGAGITLLGSLWAVVAAVFIAVGGLLAWPIKLLIRRMKGAAPAEEQVTTASVSGTIGDSTGT